MIKKIVLACAVVTLVTGCASVPMESGEASNQAKKFNAPSQGKAGVYVYRTSGAGTALKKDILIDGNCLGETAPNVFFYDEVAGNVEHTVATESEFSANEIKLVMQAGINYFIRQYIKLGVFVGGAGLEVVAIRLRQMIVITP